MKWGWPIRVFGASGFVWCAKAGSVGSVLRRRASTRLLQSLSHALGMLKGQNRSET